MPALALLAFSWCAVSFSEIQAAPPTGTPEWVEIAAAAGTDLGGWTLDDGVSAKSFPAGSTVPAGGILVATSDCAGLRAGWPGTAIPCATLSGWNRLSTDSDQVVLRDLAGRAIDSVAWTSRRWGSWPTGCTRERGDLGSRACDPSNWFASTLPGGTPGWIPTGLGRGIGGLRAEPRTKVAVPGRSNILDVSGPAGRNLRVELCDLRRRRLAVLWDALPPSDGVVEWDARAEGRNLAPGVYGLLAAAGSEMVRTWVVVGKP